jgi:hypothetical protein
MHSLFADKGNRIFLVPAVEHRTGKRVLLPVSLLRTGEAMSEFTLTFRSRQLLHAVEARGFGAAPEPDGMFSLKTMSAFIKGMSGCVLYPRAGLL